ncbi:MAG: fructose-1,6-bisphosphatase [Leptospirales bacterium]|nr:fructose-1,6-bisphosphatase [Leptospirales bacterium]
MATQQSALRKMLYELSDIERQLDEYIDTTLWISDPHGEGNRFVSILKGRFGLVWQTLREALPKTIEHRKLDYIDRIIRREQYFRSEEYKMERQDIISALASVIRYKVQNIHAFERAAITIAPELKQLINNLLLNFKVPAIVYENDLVSDQVITALTKMTKQVLIGHLIVLGDVFDRGDEPDKILRILSSKAIRPYVKFVWGNHDLLWMGAALGNKSLIAEALRITFRYDNFAFVKRLGIDSSKLQAFAEKTYPGEITGYFKAKTKSSKQIEKALAVIQFKLEEQTIKQYPQLEMESRLNLDNLAKMLKEGDTSGLSDTDFPTLDFDAPDRLTDEELLIINDLSEQFVSSKQIYKLMEYLFREGRLYHVHNYIFNIHALIPSTANGEFDELYGKKGKELLDHLEDSIKEAGEQYLRGETVAAFQQAIMFYLWCGPLSPFFGKHAMKTFERYFMKDKKTHEEKTLHWGKNLLKKEFLDLIEEEFGAKIVVYGHTPVDVAAGQQIASPDGRAINIDGGFSEAYLGRGHALIQTPYSIYAIILPTEQEMAEASLKKEPAPLMVKEIAYYEKPVKIKDTFTGKELLKRRDQLLEEIEKYNS